MNEVVFIVCVQDFAYEKPLVKYKYSGLSAKSAYEYYDRALTSNDGKLRITLDLVEETFSKRLETFEGSDIK